MFQNFWIQIDRYWSASKEYSMNPLEVLLKKCTTSSVVNKLRVALVELYLHSPQKMQYTLFVNKEIGVSDQFLGSLLYLNLKLKFKISNHDQQFPSNVLICFNLIHFNILYFIS